MFLWAAILLNFQGDLLILKSFDLKGNLLHNLFPFPYKQYKVISCKECV